MPEIILHSDFHRSKTKLQRFNILLEEYKGFHFSQLTKDLKFRINDTLDQLRELAHDKRDPDHEYMFNTWLQIPEYDLTMYKTVYEEVAREKDRIIYAAKTISDRTHEF